MKEIKYYCDICRKEITNKNLFKVKLPDLTFYNPNTPENVKDYEICNECANDIRELKETIGERRFLKRHNF